MGSPCGHRAAVPAPGWGLEGWESPPPSQLGSQHHCKERRPIAGCAVPSLCPLPLPRSPSRPRNAARLPPRCPAAMAESHSWWKLTFLRKRKSMPKVLYDSPDIHAGDGPEAPGEEGTPDFAARLEKIVDKSTKGKHVKVSNSGRFKEKKKVRPTLAENPGLCADGEREDK